MWELNHKEGWVLKSRCFWTVVLKKTLESPLDSEEIQLVHPKGNQSWIPIGRTDAEAETPVLWPPDAKSRLIGKDPDAGKDWGQEEKRTTENEMVGWHHRISGHECEQTPRNSEGQGGLACCSPWGHKESDTTEWLNSDKASQDCLWENLKHRQWHLYKLYPEGKCLWDINITPGSKGETTGDEGKSSWRRFCMLLTNHPSPLGHSSL